MLNSRRTGITAACAASCSSLTLLLAAPAGAEAAEPACTVTGPEAKAERTLRDEIRVRRAHGFRSDRAYVAKLIAAGPPSRRYGIRLTRAEDRYLDRWWRWTASARGRSWPGTCAGRRT